MRRNSPAADNDDVASLSGSRTRATLARTVLGILVGLVCLSCGTADAPEGDIQLTARLGNLLHRHDLYYIAEPGPGGARTLEIAFSMDVDPGSVSGNVGLHHRDGSLTEHVQIEVAGSVVTLELEDGFHLQPGWQYFVSLDGDVHSAGGHALGQDARLEIRTAAPDLLAACGESGARTAIVCISDVHMGEERAVEQGYCWFGGNAAALEDLLENVGACPEVRELVVLGDLFDEWLVPFDVRPFDDGVTDSPSYFRSVRQAPTNAPVCDAITDIASGGVIKTVYVRGNHDMLTDEATLATLLPGVVFRGQIDGLGSYRPVDGFVLEHGHRYDFFNSPQPLVNPGHILPPGYFVSRMWAAGMAAKARSAGSPSAGLTATGPSQALQILFPLAWDGALIYSEAQFPDLTPPPLQEDVVLMTGIDGYTAATSFDGAKTMYVDGNIEGTWTDTQDAHGVVATLPVSIGLTNGQSDLFVEAEVEYLEQEDRGVRIVVFGHTHKPMLDVHPPGPDHTGIYANTGSWIDEDAAGDTGGSTNMVRTFVVLWPAAWTGSNLDVVALYQYGLSADGETYEAVKIAEESLSIDDLP